MNVLHRPVEITPQKLPFAYNRSERQEMTQSSRPQSKVNRRAGMVHF